MQLNSHFLQVKWNLFIALAIGQKHAHMVFSAALSVRGVLLRGSKLDSALDSPKLILQHILQQPAQGRLFCDI